MKYAAILLVIITACLPGMALAQDDMGGGTTAAKEGTSLGIVAQGMLPMGDFGDVANFGVGGTVYLSFGVAPQLCITARSGYLYFGGEDIPVTGGTAKATYNTIPILGGLKYFFSSGDSRVYAAAEAGMYMTGGSVEFTPTGGGATTEADFDSESDFGIAPALGAQFRAGESMMVDVHANWTNVMSDPSSTSWVTFGIGFEFGL